jgi:hypothetical protein
VLMVLLLSAASSCPGHETTSAVDAAATLSKGRMTPKAHSRHPMGRPLLQLPMLAAGQANSTTGYRCPTWDRDR